MAGLNFRALKAEEIECRIAMVKQNGVSILLYKDARVDQRILDETVGPMNWQREHTRDNANCIVSLWDAEKNQWIKKEDTGTESNTEKEKGLASDSFKRSCFNWGIGRELYTAPFIWIKPNDCQIQNGKCYDRFSVQSITITDGIITQLEIVNDSMKRVVFSFGKKEAAPFTNSQADPAADPAPVLKDADWKALQAMAKRKGQSLNAIYQQYEIKKKSDMTFELFMTIMQAMEAMEDVSAS